MENEVFLWALFVIFPFRLAHIFLSLRHSTTEKARKKKQFKCVNIWKACKAHSPRCLLILPEMRAALIIEWINTIKSRSFKISWAALPDFHLHLSLPETADADQFCNQLPHGLKNRNGQVGNHQLIRKSSVFKHPLTTTVSFDSQRPTNAFQWLNVKGSITEQKDSDSKFKIH